MPLPKDTQFHDKSGERTVWRADAILLPTLPEPDKHALAALNKALAYHWMPTLRISQ
jgi:hypothetical protein